jgi:hypothetical protein
MDICGFSAFSKTLPEKVENRFQVFGLVSKTFLFCLEQPIMFLFQSRHKMPLKKINFHISAHIHPFDELMAGA